jgi:hypothetical protein
MFVLFYFIKQILKYTYIFSPLFSVFSVQYQLKKQEMEGYLWDETRKMKENIKEDLRKIVCHSAMGILQRFCC